jgi:hypothetical protein
MSEVVKQYEDNQVTNEHITNEPVTNELVKQNDSLTKEPVTNEPVTNEPVTNEPVKQDDPVANELVKQDDSDLKVPNNLKSVERIFLRPFAGVYYDENNNLFYSTRTVRRSRTFQPLKWTPIKYVYPRGKKEGPRYIRKTYYYVSLPLGDRKFFRLSEKEWLDWLKVNKTNNLNLE